MSKTILIVEDEVSLAKILHYDLENAGFDVMVAHDGEEGLKLYQKHHFSCVIIDWMIPIINGVELIKKIRAIEKKSLLVMLTAKTTEFDAIEGLASGADLYLKKPISNRELIAQIKALLGYFKADKSPEANLVFGDLVLDTQQYTVRLQDQVITFTKMEFDLLKFFILNKENVLSRDTILNSVWGFEYDGTTRIVDVHVYNIKKKLEKSDLHFKAIRGVGYSLLLK
jgi:two-component system alkaline phosphatase synthesis response regulator PhoP